MSKPLHTLSAAEILAGYKSGTFTPVDIVTACIARAEVLDATYKALCYPRFDESLIEARASAERWATGTPTGVLDGVPVLVKDNIAMEGIPSPKGTVALADAAPEPEDAPSVARLREAGAIFLAKTTMPDMGMMASGHSTLWDHCRNPWDPAKNTSGSSSGSAAALVLGIAPIALGTDICGSVRNPAAWCGVFGHKASYGRIPHLPPAVGRHCGPMTRTVEDTQLVMNVIARDDPRDFSALPDNTEDYMQPPLDLTDKTIGMLIDPDGFPPTDQSITARVIEAGEACHAAGANVIDLPKDGWAAGMEAWRDYLGAFSSKLFADLGPKRRAKLPANMVEWARLYEPSDARGVIDSIAALDAYRTYANQVFNGVDFALSTVMSETPFAADATGPGSSAKSGVDHLWYVGLFSATGQPACSMPWGLDAQNMPVGLQIIGRKYDDMTVLRAARALEPLSPKLEMPVA